MKSSFLPKYEPKIVRISAFVGKIGKALLKVSKFQSKFMKSSFLPKYEPNICFIFWEKQ